MSEYQLPRFLLEAPDLELLDDFDVTAATCSVAWHTRERGWRKPNKPANPEAYNICEDDNK